MWIRSQDRGFIKQVKAYRMARKYTLDKYGSLVFIDKFGINDEEDVELGVYSSKEKALQVLDMIERAIILEERIFEMPYDVGGGMSHE